MEGRNVIVFILTMLFLILIVGSIGALIFHVVWYNVPMYTTKEVSINGSIAEEVVLSEDYIGKRDTNVFLQILALFSISASLFYVGLLNYLKRPTQPKIKQVPIKKFED